MREFSVKKYEFQSFFCVQQGRLIGVMIIGGIQLYYLHLKGGEGFIKMPTYANSG